MFKEIADIKTSDQLKLPVPEAEYETVVLKPTEQQKEIVESLGERAEVVRNGGVDAAVDNMLKITNDGRKLALDQRLVNELLPDNPETLPDGSTQIWQNTNAFLDPTSEYYNENVCGIKTGSLSDDYNLIVLYQQHGKEFLICSLGSQSDSSRYDDVNFILKTIDESYYLTQ